MTTVALVPLIGALLCSQVAIAFAILFLRVSRRPADAWFAALAAGLAVMSTASYASHLTTDSQVALRWLRLEYAGAMVATIALLLFVPELLGSPLRYPLLPLTAGGGMTALAFTDWFLVLPTSPVTRERVAAETHGPLFPYMTVLLATCAVGAWSRLGPALKLRKSPEFAPLVAQVRLIFVGGALVIAAGAAVIVNLAFFPQLRFPINPLPLAVLAFCLLTAIALGRETLRAEHDKRSLTELLRFRDEAVREVAHELRNPLSAIYRALTTAQRGAERGLAVGDQRELLTMSIDATTRLTRLLNNMLDTARLDAGREVEVRCEATDVTALAHRVVAAQQLTAPRHRITLESELNGPTVTLDADKLHQILTNLIVNAIKFSPEGGEVRVRMSDGKGELSVQITDPGIGLSPEQQARLFQPFERAERERKFTGTGLGLHLVKRLVEAQGGRIWIESEPDHGCTFAFTIPTDHNRPSLTS